MSYLPIDIRLSKFILMGHVLDVMESCIIIAACLSTEGMYLFVNFNRICFNLYIFKGIFRREFAEGLNAFKSRMAWADRSFSTHPPFRELQKCSRDRNLLERHSPRPISAALRRNG